jgi:hypothetical protein
MKGYKKDKQRKPDASKTQKNSRVKLKTLPSDVQRALGTLCVSGLGFSDFHES